MIFKTPKLFLPEGKRGVGNGVNFKVLHQVGTNLVYVITLNNEQEVLNTK